MMGGRIYAQLKSKGRLVGIQYILIAAICAAYDLPLYTKNVAHFSEIKDTRILSPEQILSPATLDPDS